MSPWQMMFAHRFREAEVLYANELQQSPDDPSILGEHGTAFVCLGRFSEALAEFKKANAAVAKRSGGESQPYRKDIGALLWLLGRHEEALQIFKSSADGILDGSIQFGDLSGGMSHGLLLWYAGVSLPDRGATDYAYNFLLRLGKRSKAQYWPGPIGHFILGRKSREEVLEAACETRDFAGAITAAKTDLLKRRQLVQALFYFATKERSEGREQECLSLMKQCAGLENPIIEIEWFLAKGEVDRASQRS